MGKSKKNEVVFNFIINVTIIALFFVFNLKFVENLYMSVIFTLISSMFFVLLFKLFDGNKILVYRIRDIFYSGAVSLIGAQFVSFLFFLITDSVASALCKSLIEYIVCTSTLLILIYFLNNSYYSPKIKNRTLIVYRDEEEKNEFLNKIKRYKNRYGSVDSVSDQDYNADNDADKIICLTISNEVRKKIISDAYELEREVVIIPSIDDVMFSSGEFFHIIDVPFYYLSFVGASKIEAIAKRFIDLLFCVPAFILFAPVMLVLMILIKLDDWGPVFYKQERVTKNGKKFNVIKFRSMVVNAEKNGKAQLSYKNDDRVTRVGKFIRKTRLDELPQLLNIILGDMSIVGPRPEREELIEEYVKDCPEFKYRLSVKAGLTGLAQVEGKYNTTPCDKLKLDLIYITNFSLILDLKIMVKTIKILFINESTEGVDKIEK